MLVTDVYVIPVRRFRELVSPLLLIAVPLCIGGFPRLATAQEAHCPAYLKNSGRCPETAVKPDTPGKVNVESVPAGAAIFWSGKRVGVTPHEFSNVDPGVYDLRVALEGKEPWHEPVLVRPGESVEVHLTLCGPGKRPVAAGICCWLGQIVDGNQCAGEPKCPFFYEEAATKRDCELKACTQGREHVLSGACCWPGQTWDDEAMTCVGRPSACPGDLTRTWNDCVRPPSRRDKDADGITNDRDACIDEAEDRDSYEDNDGCPDEDNDSDGIADTADRCPMAAEDRDFFEDADGCPDRDNDGDGLADARDHCPEEAEDRDGFQDSDGCRDDDRDHDGILQGRDECPTESENDNDFRDGDGCPDHLPVLAEWADAAGHRAAYGIGVTRGGLPAGSPPSLEGAIRIRLISGFEAGARLLAIPQNIDTELFVGAAPFHVGLWWKRKGGQSISLLDPFAQVAVRPGSPLWPPTLSVGNRLVWRGKTWWALEVAYVVGNRRATTDGFRAAITVSPNMDWRGGRLSRPIGVQGSFLTTLLSRKAVLLGRAMATWQGLSAGLTLGAISSESNAIVGPSIELSPLRFGTGRVHDGVWKATFDLCEPFIGSDWLFGLDHPPSITTGLRLTSTLTAVGFGPDIVYRFASPEFDGGFQIGFHVRLEGSR